MPAHRHNREVARVAAALRKLPGLANSVERDRNRYSSLAYCVLAAIFSINARYTAVQALLNRYRERYDLPPLRVMDVVSAAPEPTISDLIGQIEAIGVKRFARYVLRNRMRTSTRNGVLKASAVLDYAKTLQSYGIERIADVLAYPDVDELEAVLRRVPGQASGISTGYFFMSAGDTMRVKPDRWIIAFLERSLKRKVTPAQATSLFVDVSSLLGRETPGISPRALDLLVWNAERARAQATHRPIDRIALVRRIRATEQRLSHLREMLAKVDANRSGHARAKLRKNGRSRAH